PSYILLCMLYQSQSRARGIFFLKCRHTCGSRHLAHPGTQTHALCRTYRTRSLAFSTVTEVTIWAAQPTKMKGCGPICFSLRGFKASAAFWQLLQPVPPPTSLGTSSD